MNAGRIFAALVRCALVLAVTVERSASGQGGATPPEVTGQGLEAVLFAQEPMIQQPIGAAVDGRGRLLVIESHTHFRPKDWQGPENDQVVALVDDNGDDRADRREVFFDGTQFTMDIAMGADGWVYLATRNEILRVRDRDGDGRAEEVERKLIQVQTEGTYPHNGLSGLAFDGKGGFYFGMGENLGFAYTIQGADGVSYSDQAEGGNVWHARLDGKNLRRIATGFWNPFGVCVDPAGEVFATDNDPGERPPCRLIHVVNGGDYGFQFRYGRGGTHPFVSWDGRRPGTLPPITGVGEAPCDVLCYLPKASPKYRGLGPQMQGRLLVASWADHRVEAYALTPRSGSGTFEASREVLCQGGADFWPVGLAVRGDGALFVTDWARRSYELHGSGRVWLLRQQQARPLQQVPEWTRPVDPATALCDQIQHGPAPSEERMLQWLAAREPLLFLTAVHRLSREGALAKRMAAGDYQLDPQVRAGLLLASRLGIEREGVPMEALPREVAQLLAVSIRDIDPQVALIALHWVSDHRMERLRFLVQGVVNDPEVSEPVFVAALTALDRMDFKEEALFSEQRLAIRLKELLGRPSLDLRTRLLALRVNPGSETLLTGDLARTLLAEAGANEKTWLAHHLGQLPGEAKSTLLRALAFDEKEDAVVRAAALSHLEVTEADAPSLMALVASDSAALRGAALSGLRGLRLSFDQQQSLKQLAGGPAEMAARRVLGEPFFSTRRPAATDIKAWMRYLESVPGEPDAAHGRDVFLSPARGGCAVCHRVEGLGNRAGPDLTHMGAGAGREALLTSLLQPNASISPQYAAWSLQTADGRSLMVFQLSESGGTHRYMDIKGKEHVLKIEEIARRQQLPASIMPPGLVDRLTDEEVRDLLHYLTREERDTE